MGRLLWTKSLQISEFLARPSVYRARRGHGKTREDSLNLPRFFPKRGKAMKFTLTNVRTWSDFDKSKAEHIVFDETMPGFGLRIRVGGKTQHRTFIAQYKIGSKHRRITLGNVAKVTLEDAKQRAKIIFGKVADGKDPANEKAEARQVASHTLGA